MGRRRYDTQYPAVWCALFELFVPIERALGPAYRLRLRERADALRTDRSAEIGPGSTRVALETAFQVSPLPVSTEEMDRLLRASAAEIPDAAIRAISVRPEFLGHVGPRATVLLGVLCGMILAAVARASYSARVKWIQSIDWSRMSRLL